MSANGYIGLLPEAAQEGDQLCVFMGGRTPFVIRPIKENYQLIGACYVHGIIYGEAMVDLGKQCREFRDFVLV